MELFKNPPKLHRPTDSDTNADPATEDGLVSWGMQESFLRRLAGLVTSSSLTLETGSGISTVCLAIIGGEHICISPVEKEHRRIRRYCADHNISTERVRFVPLCSDAVLPSLDLVGRKLDFVLIDGDHKFPGPIIDYYFVNQHLKVGGFLAVDDINIPSVGALHKFLTMERAYELVEIDRLKTGLYRKIGETSGGWLEQRYNEKYPDFSYLAFHTRVREEFRPLEHRLRTALRRVPGARGLYHWFKDRSQTRHSRAR